MNIKTKYDVGDKLYTVQEKEYSFKGLDYKRASFREYYIHEDTIQRVETVTSITILKKTDIVIKYIMQSGKIYLEKYDSDYFDTAEKAQPRLEQYRQGYIDILPKLADKAMAVWAD